MVTTEGSFASESSSEEPRQTAPRRRLEKNTSDRMLLGVASGLGEYLDVDANIVRIAFVVLCLFGGVGVVLYGAGWLLMPEEGRPSMVASLFTGTRWHNIARAIGLVILVIVVVSLLAAGPLWDLNGWHAGRVVGLLIAAGLIALLLLRRFHPYVASRPRISLGRIFRRLALTFTGLISLVVLATFIAVLVSGVSLRGGIGSRQWRPTSVAQLSSSYRAGIGNMTLDLREVAFPNRATHVDASVAIGHLVVEVPSNVTVSLTAHAGIGDVVYGDGGQDFFTSGSDRVHSSKPGPLLVLIAQAGIGEVQLIRGS